MRKTFVYVLRKGRVKVVLAVLSFRVLQGDHEPGIISLDKPGKNLGADSLFFNNGVDRNHPVIQSRLRVKIEIAPDHSFLCKQDQFLFGNRFSGASLRDIVRIDIKVSVLLLPVQDSVPGVRIPSGLRFPLQDHIDCKVFISIFPGNAVHFISVRQSGLQDGLQRLFRIRLACFPLIGAQVHHPVRIPFGPGRKESPQLMPDHLF